MNRDSGLGAVLFAAAFALVVLSISSCQYLGALAFKLEAEGRQIERSK